MRAEHVGHAQNFPANSGQLLTDLSGAGLQFLLTPPPGPALPTESCRTEVLQRTVLGCSFSSRTQSLAQRSTWAVWGGAWPSGAAARLCADRHSESSDC